MITGSIVAIVTPMADNGDLDLSAMSELLEWHVSEGTDAVVAVGTTGESATLDVEEHFRVIKHTVHTIAGRIPVIAGTGANSTREAIEWTDAAKQAGADACLLVTPYYNKPSQRGLFAHHKCIAESVDIPQILYNVPGRTACDILPETIEALSRIKNIIGVKEATGDVERGKQVMDLCGEKFAVFSGDDPTAVELMLLGAAGNVSVTANVVPARMHQLCTLAMSGESVAARALNDKLAELHRVLFLEANPVPVKWALQEMGKIQSGIRLPLVALDEQFHEPLRQCMQELGIL